MICSLLHPVKVQSTGSPVKSRSGDASSVRLPPNFGAAKEDDCRSLDSTMVKMLPPVKGPSSAFQPPPRREAPVTCTSLGKCSFQRLGMCGGSRKDHEKERRIRRVCVGLDLRRDGFLLQSLTWWTHISPPRKTAAFSKKKKKHGVPHLPGPSPSERAPVLEFRKARSSVLTRPSCAGLVSLARLRRAPVDKVKSE